MHSEIIKPKNIYCVGRNYVNHAKELKNDIPKEPMIFMKPTHSVVYTKDKPIVFPSQQGAVHYEVELVIYIGNEVTDSMIVDDIVTKMALGIDFTLRDVQTILKQKGRPWLKAKGFPNSSLLTPFWDFPGVHSFNKTTFQLVRNDQVVQQGKANQMIFDIKTIVEYIHQQFGLSRGDIIYTGTPAGVGAIKDKDAFLLEWGVDCKGRFSVQL